MSEALALHSLKDGRPLPLEGIENDLATASLILTGVIGALEEVMADTDLYDSFYPKMHLVIAAIGRTIELVEGAMPDSDRMKAASAC